MGTQVQSAELQRASQTAPYSLRSLIPVCKRATARFTDPVHSKRPFTCLDPRSMFVWLRRSQCIRSRALRAAAHGRCRGRNRGWYERNAHGEVNRVRGGGEVNRVHHAFQKRGRHHHVHRQPRTTSMPTVPSRCKATACRDRGWQPVEPTKLAAVERFVTVYCDAATSSTSVYLAVRVLQSAPRAQASRICPAISNRCDKEV